MQSKLVLFLLILLSTLNGCNFVAQEKVKVQGEFPKITNAKLFIYQILPQSRPLIDSVLTDAYGKFSLSLPVTKSGFYSLKRNENDEIILIISPGETLAVKGNDKNLHVGYSVEGSEESKLFAEYNHFTNTNLLKVDSLSRIFTYGRMNADFQKVKSNLDSAYLQIFNDQQHRVVSFVSEHLNSLASLLVISENFGPNPLVTQQSHPDLFLKLDSALINAHPENSHVNTFHLRMLDFKAEIVDIQAHDSILKPGKRAPEIALPNSSGKETKLSSLKGNLVLVYFWSSWNAVSRQMNMKFSTLYNKFHKAGFEIYAVSLDSDAELWKNAFTIDRAYWINVIDTKGLASEFSKVYGIKSLPGLVLISKEGNILSRQPEIIQLEELIKKNL